MAWAQVEDYLRLHHTQEMLESAVQPGYPPDTPDRALALHLSYLLTDQEKLANESREDSDEKLFVLRPFVFAAHKVSREKRPLVSRSHLALRRSDLFESISLLLSQPLKV